MNECRREQSLQGNQYTAFRRPAFVSGDRKKFNAYECKNLHLQKHAIEIKSHATSKFTNLVKIVMECLLVVYCTASNIPLLHSKLYVLFYLSNFKVFRHNQLSPNFQNESNERALRSLKF